MKILIIFLFWFFKILESANTDSLKGLKKQTWENDTNLPKLYF